LTNALAQGAHASDVFSYTQSDHHGGTSTTTLTIDITGTNDAPVAATDVNAGDAIVEQGVGPGNTAVAGVASATGNVLSNDFDIDTGDTKTVQGVASGTVTGSVTGQLAESVAGAYGSVTIAADGTWTYTLNNTSSATQALNQGDHVSDIFTYTMRDAFGSTSTATLTIAVTGTNDAPIAAADVNAGAQVVEQGVDSGNTVVAGVDTATGNVLFNDSDVDAGDIKTVQGVASGTVTGSVTGQVAESVAGTYGSVTIAADGTWTYTLDNGRDATQALKQGDHVTDVFTYTMRDTLGSTASATLTIDISGTNDSPVITSDGAGASAAISIAENSTAVTTVQATDVDGSSRTYSIVTGEDSPDATKFIINPVTGALSFAAAPNFEIPASEAESAVYTVQVQVEDGAGGLDVQTIIVTVTDVAEAAPVIVTNAFTVTENENGTTTVKGLYVTDADATADETFHITTETEADLTDGGVEPALLTIPAAIRQRPIW
jgi:VCBS repeat-containing protein